MHCLVTPNILHSPAARVPRQSRIMYNVCGRGSPYDSRPLTRSDLASPSVGGRCRPSTHKLLSPSEATGRGSRAQGAPLPPPPRDLRAVLDELDVVIRRLPGAAQLTAQPCSDHRDYLATRLSDLEAAIRALPGGPGGPGRLSALHSPTRALALAPCRAGPTPHSTRAGALSRRPARLYRPPGARRRDGCLLLQLSDGRVHGPGSEARGRRGAVPPRRHLNRRVALRHKPLHGSSKSVPSRRPLGHGSESTSTCGLRV